jgi:hypothetical protein
MRESEMAYQFIISTDPKTGADLASCDGFHAKSSRSCAARVLARMLMDAEWADGPIEARRTDGRLRYTVKRLHAFAARALVENPALHTTPYREIDRSRFAPALASDQEDAA